jgi:hypothetical protein
VTTKIFLNILLAAISLSACDSCEDEIPTELPAETQTGANTFGCYVNELLFIPKLHDWKFTTFYDIEAIYSRNYNYLSIESYSPGLGSIEIKLNNPTEYNPTLINQIYFRSYTDLLNCVSYQSYNTGNITLTKFDTVNFIVSGTFESNINCAFYKKEFLPDSISITNGRFDIKLEIY